MLLIDSRLSVAEFSSFLLLLLEQSLVARSIQQHSLRVFVSACLHLLVIVFSAKLQLLFKLVFNLILGCLELFDFAPDLQLLS